MARSHRRTLPSAALPFITCLFTGGGGGVMDTGVLPVQNPDRSLDEALWRMREANRSAVLVVRKFNKEYGLAYIGSVRRAQAKGKKTLGQIEDMHAAPVTDPAGAGKYNLDLQNLHGTWKE